MVEEREGSTAPENIPAEQGPPIQVRVPRLPRPLLTLNRGR